jgi:ABC-2 type transport system permease protein
MNFVIFPLFFASTALYPLWRLEDASPVLGAVAAANPFTHVVELIRFALYQRINAAALLWVTVAFLAFLAAALWCYRPGGRTRGIGGGE